MLTSMLNPEQRFWRFFAPFVGVVAVLKGLRLPLIYAASNAQLTYEFGFVKRGLFGTVAEYLHIPIYHYFTFALVAYVILALYVVALFAAMYHSRLLSTVSGLKVCAVFLSSYALTFTAQLVGYFDIIQMIVVLSIISVDNSVKRNALLLVLAPLSILLHENFFIAFLPVCLLPTLLDLIFAKQRKPSFTGIALAAGALVVSIVTVVIVAGSNSHDLHLVDALQQRIVSRVDFKFYDLRNVETWGLWANMALMEWSWGSPARWVAVPFSLIVYLPSAAFFVFCCARIFKSLSPERARLATGAVIACVCAPLALNLLGADMERWNTFVVFDCFAAVLIVVRPAFAGILPQEQAMSPDWTYAVIFLIATNLACGSGLLNGQCQVSYPFRYDGQFLYRFAHGAPLRIPEFYVSPQLSRC